MHIGRARKCVDDDYDDSGGRTQRDCLTLAAPDRKVSSQTEAKTNTVRICEQRLLSNIVIDHQNRHHYHQMNEPVCGFDFIWSSF